LKRYNGNVPKFLIKYGGIIVKKENIDETFKEINDLLLKGEIVGIFPEGYYSKTGEIQHFHSGVGRIASESVAPVVPVAIKGSYELCPGGKMLPKWRKLVRIRIGKPMTFKNNGNEYKDYKEISQEVEKTIRELFDKT